MKLYCDSSLTEGCFQFEGELPVRWTYNPPIATHNIGEYLAVESALEVARLLARWKLDVVTDSQLVVGQTTLGWKIKAPHLRSHVERVKNLLVIIESTLRWVPREENLAGIELEHRAERTVWRKVE